MRSPSSWALEFVDGPLDGQRLPTCVDQMSYHLETNPLQWWDDEGEPIEPVPTRQHCYVRGRLCSEERPRPGVVERIELEVWIYQGCHD